MRQFVIVGLGRFGKKVAITLSQAGMPVVAIDKDPRKVEAISDKVAYAIRADATDQKALSTLGLTDADVAIISMGDLLEASVLATIILKEFGIPTIIVKGISPEHGRILKLVGATTVVFPEEDMALRVAQKIISPNILEHIPLLPGYSIVEFLTPKSFQGKTLLGLNLRRNYGVEVLLIKRGNEVKMIPSAMDRINENDTLVIMGTDEDIRRIHLVE